MRVAPCACALYLRACVITALSPYRIVCVSRVGAALHTWTCGDRRVYIVSYTASYTLPVYTAAGSEKNMYVSHSFCPPCDLKNAHHVHACTHRIYRHAETRHGPRARPAGVAAIVTIRYALAAHRATRSLYRMRWRRRSQLSSRALTPRSPGRPVGLRERHGGAHSWATPTSVPATTRAPHA